jgi:hypothetical protein
MRGGMIFNPGGTRAVARVVILLLAAHLGSESRVRAQTLEDQRKRANDAFQYGDFGAAIQVLSHMDIEGLPTERERIEAYRVLGLSYFYAKKPTPGEATQKAREAFFGLLKQDPDFQLDALFVPPDAIAFFDRIRQEEEPALAPVRKIHNELKQKEAEQERIRREAQPGKPRIVNVAVSSQVVALLPFGFGQFQNGSRAGCGRDHVDPLLHHGGGASGSDLRRIRREQLPPGQELQHCAARRSGPLLRPVDCRNL